MNEDPEKKFYDRGLMDLSRYSLVAAEMNADWDAFVDASREGTLFSESVFLSALQGKAGLWYCLRSEERAAAVAVMECPDGKSAVGYPNVIYNGVMFAPPPAKQNKAQVMSEQFRILAFISRALAEHYQSVSMTLQASITDMRPFLWHNYHEDGPKYAVDLRYTNQVDLADYGPADTMADVPGYAAANKSRRQELRYAQKKGYVTVERYDPDLFLDQYRQTFARQGMTMDGTGIEELPRLLSQLNDAGRLRMFVTMAPGDIPGATGIFAADGKRWYYLFGAGNPEIRDGHAGSLMLWDAMNALAQTPPGILDMEGVNSPLRGYFKLSYGGTLTPYYRVRYPAA